MATLAANDLTIADAAKRMRPTGQIADIGELLNQKNGIVADIPWVEGDTPGGHMVVQRTTLPTIATRVANAGVAASKSTTAQTLESPEILEGWCKIDEVVATYGGDIAGKRSSEAVAFSEAMNQTVALRYFYGNGSTTVGQLNGFAQRFGATSGVNGDNVILGGAAGGQTDCSSIYLIGWGKGKVYGWYPKGSAGGLNVIDWGKQIEVDSSGNQQVMYKEQWQWSIGLAVEDWRYVVRIANIDCSLLDAASAADLFELMVQATHCIPDLGSCRPSFYMNRTVRMRLDIQARNEVQTGGQLSYQVVDGRPIEMFRGIPITLCDQLTEAETAIS